MKIIFRVALSLLCLFIACPGLLFRADTALALDDGYRNAFKRELQQIVGRSPKYVWGGSESEAKGLDCSGMVYLAARRAGMPVQRTTARRMADGDGGWYGVDVQRAQSGDADIVWWSFTSERPYGHVGVAWGGPGHVVHASPSKGAVTVSAVRGTLKTKMSKVRRLGHGEANHLNKPIGSAPTFPSIDVTVKEQRPNEK